MRPPSRPLGSPQGSTSPDGARPKVIPFIYLLLIGLPPSLLIAETRAPTQERPPLERSYEEEVTLNALSAHGLIQDPIPSGRRVRTIHLIALPVFLKSERLSALSTPLNHLHRTTRPWVIRRELRLRKGALWDEGDALETERNLRGLRIFSSVQVIPVMSLSSETDSTDATAEMEVDVAVVTRDLWSLRLESAFDYNDGVLNQLNLNLTERNLLGHRVTLSLLTSLTPFVFSAGLLSEQRRFGPDLSLSLTAGGSWNRETGDREGQSVGVSLARPLYNLDQSYALYLNGGWASGLSRLTQAGALISEFDPSGLSAKEYPIEWRVITQRLSLGASRQWSGPIQHRLSVGIGYSDTTRTIDQAIPEPLSARWRSTYLAPDRAQLGPTLSYSFYRRSYLTLRDVSTFGLSEDLRTGPRLTTSHSVSLWGDRAYSPALSFGWTFYRRGGFISLGLGSSVRRPLSQPELDTKAQEWVNLRVSSSSVMISPKWGGLGRLVLRGRITAQWRDQQNALVSLGGINGLRGYPSGAFYVPGGDIAQGNIEYRTSPWVWGFVHIGGVLFYDGGSVHPALDALRWKQSAGLGARLLFPQFNRSVFRVDLAQPLSEPGWAIIFSGGSRQAFGVMGWEE